MKNKELEYVIKRLKFVTPLKNYCTSINGEEIKLLLSYIEQLEKEYNRSLDKLRNLRVENEQLENNRDKAIEIIDLITPELWNISNAMTYKLKDIKYLLKGDSDDNKRNDE